MRPTDRKPRCGSLLCYRLEWQGVGSLQRRLRNCLFGLRAELYAFGSSKLVALELFLMQRARGMTIETPAVRP
jgi:sulfur-oxidizing protein SoxA